MSASKYRVELTRDAERDLVGIARYIAEYRSIEQARYVLGNLRGVVNKQAMFPKRGALPAELLALGIREYRQVFFKPYRVIYRVFGKRVIVMLIADGRRDMVTVLAERLL
ncbi:MAG: type II toxin-antitoxin system RelE/ParE family toxin [Betaproteobacteria bacterium]|nr:type II toxin-antitoxin system RelE/ParE family toxin [Betaproteobacteria bacterium]